jgi:hypothetical protein
LVSKLEEMSKSNSLAEREAGVTGLVSLRKAEEHTQAIKDRDAELKAIKDAALEQRKSEETDKKEAKSYGVQNEIEKRWESQYKTLDENGKPVMNNDEAVARTIFNGDRLPESKREMQNRISPRVNNYFKNWFADKTNQEMIKKYKLDQNAINQRAQNDYLKFYHPTTGK